MVGKKIISLTILAIGYLIAAALTLSNEVPTWIASIIWLVILTITGSMLAHHDHTKQTMKSQSSDQLKTQIRVERQRMETIINSINDVIMHVSTRGNVKLYNAAALALLDTNQDINGKNVDDLLHLIDENGDKIMLSEFIRDSKVFRERNDLCHQYTDGQKINVFLSISPVRGIFDATKARSSITGFILIMRDITKQKSLDDERDEFISVVSHELRTPVAITEGTLSNLEFILAKNNADKTLVDNVKQAHQQVLFLSQMVNDLSTLSRAQRGVNMEPELIDLKLFIGELYNKYLPEAKTHQLSFDIDSTATGTVSVARMAIEEIMQNLITNAIKYTREGGVVIGIRKVSGEHAVEFFVRDTGIGISKSDQARVFQRFWRSEDYRTRETNGTGLGLHVVEQLAATIHTQIELKSRLNHGSTFSFKLPLTDQTKTE
ncbi:MAG TPA: ATP-binding protein [Candidatus Nanoperiomorbaceae bacterium]|nr:ATP-binding protein [Candidatus Nanoperiomorbaceae bacterium]HMQ96994.1 ATP-binding protein [Candidatus Nanoperiomorbaceae bacterium]HMR86410.1 ATP-binding protein [Candidatus Nanoperiomorbaceae bacterium]HMU12308.1 ATP-binding protein [Candidatus Nanoperiomorbaceae bacterium]